MAFVKKQAESFYLVSGDRILYCNTESDKTEEVLIPDPKVLSNPNKNPGTLLKEPKTIISLDFSRSGDYLTIATESKQVVVFAKDFTIVRNITVKRVPSKVCFTSANEIIVADKTGDVYYYKHDSDEPVLLLGHLSVILDVIISDCGKYIITCDRDEKIRISHFPNCYNIANYCLGHTEFVNKIHLFKSTLISASGDGTVRFWDYLNGKQLSLIDTRSSIEDTNLLKTFTEEMDKEKVDVGALPITDMQIFSQGCLFIALSIYKCNAIQLYAVDVTNFNYQFITKLSFCSKFCFNLCDGLYVLSDKLYTYKLTGNNLVEEHVSTLNTFYNKYKHFIKFGTDNISTLFKRKFDNVQEYLERKKRRLECK